MKKAFQTAKVAFISGVLAGAAGCGTLDYSLQGPCAMNRDTSYDGSEVRRAVNVECQEGGAAEVSIDGNR